MPQLVRVRECFYFTVFAARAAAATGLYVCLTLAETPHPSPYTGEAFFGELLTDEAIEAMMCDEGLFDVLARLCGAPATADIRNPDPVL